LKILWKQEEKGDILLFCSVRGAFWFEIKPRLVVARSPDRVALPTEGLPDNRKNFLLRSLCSFAAIRAPDATGSASAVTAYFIRSLPPANRESKGKGWRVGDGKMRYGGFNHKITRFLRVLCGSARNLASRGIEEDVILRCSSK
jgi:hypothetical protein